ncbi:MAG: UbiA family prenyltransferase [Candidatus Aenigmatarchaeota archaeon]
MGSAFLPFVALTLLDLPIIYQPIFIVFTTTFFLYNLNRKTDIKEDSINYPQRVKLLARYGNFIFWLSFVLYFLGIFIAYVSGIKIIFFTLIPLMIMILYSILRLKKYFLLKNILASIGWASSFIFTAAFFGLETHFSTFIIFTFYFFRAMINTIICDIRDIEGDKKVGTITLPIKFGIKKTKIILQLLNILSFIIIFVSLYLKIIPKGHLISLIFIYGLFYIKKIKRKNTKLIGELVDGELYLLGFLAIFERILF